MCNTFWQLSAEWAPERMSVEVNITHNNTITCHISLGLWSPCSRISNNCNWQEWSFGPKLESKYYEWFFETLYIQNSLFKTFFLVSKVLKRGSLKIQVGGICTWVISWSCWSACWWSDVTACRSLKAGIAIIARSTVSQVIWLKFQAKELHSSWCGATEQWIGNE